MNLYPSTLGQIVGDLVESLVRTGIRKIVLLNSHGGNDLKWVLRELYGRTPAHLFLCNWYLVCRDVYGEIFEQPDDHAGEMETSLALAYFPELVARNADGSLAADEGRPAQTRFEAVNRGWVLDYAALAPADDQRRRRQSARRHGREGPPPDGCRSSSGWRQFLVELSAAEMDERFPY